MKNADIPAMPVTEEEYSPDRDEYALVQRGGLTKREYFMAHLNIDGDTMKFQSAEAIEEFIGRPVNMESVEDIALAQAEAMAKIKRIQVDADLAELEKTNG